MSYRDRYLRGWRVLADVLRNNEDLPLPYQGRSTPITLHYLSGSDPAARMIADAQKIPADFTSRIDTDPENARHAYLYLTASLHGLTVELAAYARDTCKRDEDDEWYIPSSITDIAPEAEA